MSVSESTFAAVVRSSNDRRIVLAESAGWNDYRDADVLGRRDLEQRGWEKIGVLCIEERRS